MHLTASSLSASFFRYQDVAALSEGLEGRTSNPVALVFDQLCQPYADLGLTIPSQLQWRLQEKRSVPHLVIGSAPRPGGVWQVCQQLRLNLLAKNMLVICFNW